MSLKDSFLDYLRVEKNYSPKTIIGYGGDLDEFEDFLVKMNPSLSFLSADTDIVRSWVAQMMDNKMTATTVNRKLCALRSFYRFLLLKNEITHSPVAALRGPKNKKALPSFLKESEMERLLGDDEAGCFDDSFAGVRDKTILELFYEAGLRLSELTSLTILDVDLDVCVVKVTGKRNKQRILPFGPSLRLQIERYLEEREKRFGDAVSDMALFLSEKGVPMDNAQVYYMVHKNLSRVSTQKKRSPHVLRHTFATAMLNHSARLGAVKELLGHKSLATTEIYTHTTFEELKNVYNNAHPRAKSNNK